MVFWCPYFESRFPTVVFQISEMPIELLGVGTDPLQGRFQLPTPNNSIGPSEVARDCFKAGCFRLPLVGGRFLNLFIFLNPPVLMGRWGIRPFRSLITANRGAIAAIPVVVVIIIVS